MNVNLHLILFVSYLICNVGGKELSKIGKLYFFYIIKISAYARVHRPTTYYQLLCIFKELFRFSDTYEHLLLTNLSAAGSISYYHLFLPVIFDRIFSNFLPFNLKAVELVIVVRFMGSFFNEDEFHSSQFCIKTNILCNKFVIMLEKILIMLGYLTH